MSLKEKKYIIKLTTWGTEAWTEGTRMTERNYTTRLGVLVWESATKPTSGRQSPTPTVWMLNCSQPFRYNSPVPPCQVSYRSSVGPTTPPFLLASRYGHPLPPWSSKGLLCLCLCCSSDSVTEKKRDWPCHFHPAFCDGKPSPRLHCWAFESLACFANILFGYFVS